MADAIVAVEYRELKDLPGCRVGSDGTVWTTWLRNGKKSETWRRSAVSIGKSGYLRITACKKSYYVHRLVLEAFVGKRPDGMECCHKDGNQLNNSLDNLRWGTRQENIAERDRSGTTQKGSRHYMAKVNDDKVREIRRMHASGLSQTAIASVFGVTQVTVGHIVTLKTWKHVA
jgi:hypothetical protein